MIFFLSRFCNLSTQLATGSRVEGSIKVRQIFWPLRVYAHDIKHTNGHCKYTRTRIRQIAMDLIQMYHDQNSQSSSSGEETNIVENNVFGIGASHPRIVHGNSVEQQPLKTLPPQRQQQQPHNGTNGRQLHHHVDKLQKFQPTNFAQWLTDIDNRVHLCLGSIQPLP